MRRLSLLTTLILASATSLGAQLPPLTRTAYAPLAEYMMPREAEISLARSAAPAAVSGRATIEVLTPRGYQTAARGENGFVCLVLRGWSAPTFTPEMLRALVYYPEVRAPICYNPSAVKTVLPYQKLRTALAMDGKTPAQIATAVQSAYASGRLPRIASVGFAYMFSAHQNLGPGIGAFHPHVMVFAPNQSNAMLGGNQFGGPLPFVSDDAGTPFAVTVIPVDHALATRLAEAGR